MPDINTKSLTNEPCSVVEEAMDRVEAMMPYVDRNEAIKKLQEDNWEELDAFLIVTAAYGRKNGREWRKDNG